MKNFKALFIVLLLTVTGAYAQTQYGYNGTNVPENLNSKSIQLLNEQTPVGDTLVICFRNDKYTGPCPDVEIININLLRTTLVGSGKELSIIYTFNARGAVSITDNFYALNKFIADGIPILALRLGNEEFFKVAGHDGQWSNYIATNTALLTEMEKLNYPVIFPIADPDNLIWNAAASSFIAQKSKRAPDIHFYFDKKVVPVLATLVNNTLPQEKVTQNGYLTAKDDFYFTLQGQLTASTFFEEVIDMCDELFPGKKIYVTEYGPAIGPGEIGGTIGYEYCTDWFLNKAKPYSNKIRALCRFNGPSLTGVITPVSKNDLPDLGEAIPRLGYYAITNFLNHRNATELAQITRAGTHVFRVSNMAATSQLIPFLFQYAEGLEVESYYFEGLWGKNYYSSSGATAWYGKGSEKFYEIAGTTIDSEIVPARSFGYLTVVVKDKIVLGCTDRTALNYNSLANTDDGSCYYFTDCGCKDITATNYNAEAPCQDNTKCNYAPVECRRKIFGICWKVKRNCNC